MAFKCTVDNSKILAKIPLKNLGFQPNIVKRVNPENGYQLDESNFDFIQLQTLIDQGISNYSLYSQDYNEEKLEEFIWFKFDYNSNFQTCVLLWQNRNLEFLIGSDLYNTLIGNNYLIYCYHYDLYDQMKQTNFDIYSFKRNYPGKNFKIKYDSGYRKDIVDISENWGRNISACGINFMAAPFMIFGNGYYEIIDKAKIKNFHLTTPYKLNSPELLKVELFNIYSDPESEENRKTQRDFWTFFDLERVAKDYKLRRESEIGFGIDR